MALSKLVLNKTDDDKDFMAKYAKIDWIPQV